jgi:hypothetical protein
MSVLSSLDDSQRSNATTICKIALQQQLGAAAAVIGVMTALTEAGLHNLASANVPESQHHPHDEWTGSADGLGHDHASMGMFQQQTGWQWTPANHGHAISSANATLEQSTMSNADGWGKPAVLMKPVNQATLFFASLVEVQGWSTMKPWASAQAVQHSGFSDGSNYHAMYNEARAIVDEIWPTIAPVKPGELPTPMLSILGANPQNPAGGAMLGCAKVPGATRYHWYLNGLPTKRFTKATRITVHDNGEWTVVAMKDAAGKHHSNQSNPITVVGIS